MWHWYRDGYLGSDHWETFAWEVRDYYGKRCALCNTPARDRNLDVHHRTYVRLGCEELTDCIALCRRCHDAFNHARLSEEDKRPSECPDRLLVLLTPDPESDLDHPLMWELEARAWKLIEQARVQYGLGCHEEVERLIRETSRLLEWGGPSLFNFPLIRDLVQR
jgi:hypothetical protein